jgi:hypothetical protein
MQLEKWRKQSLNQAEYRSLIPTQPPLSQRPYKDKQKRLTGETFSEKSGCVDGI